MFQSKATKQKKLVAALQGNAEASAIHRIHSTDSCLFVYLSITFTFVSSSLFIFSSLFHSFFSKVTETFGTVTAVFKATWLGTQMLTEKDLPLHVAQSTLHIQCTFLLFFKSFFLSLSLPLFYFIFRELKNHPLTTRVHAERARFLSAAIATAPEVSPQPCFIVLGEANIGSVDEGEFLPFIFK